MKDKCLQHYYVTPFPNYAELKLMSIASSPVIKLLEMLYITKTKVCLFPSYKAGKPWG